MADKKRVFLSFLRSRSRWALLLAGAAFFFAPADAFAANIARSSHPIITQPFTLAASAFSAGGGEMELKSGQIKVVTSMGTSSVSKMKGGTYVMGTGVVGGITPSEANLDKAHTFPNPYIPSKGHTFITFSQVTAQATIRIFTLNGELVKKIIKDSSGTDRITWNPVANEAGKGVASGVYHFVIQSSDGQVKTGNLMVIK